MAAFPLTGTVQEFRCLGNILPAADIYRTALINTFRNNIKDWDFTICGGTPGLLDQERHRVELKQQAQLTIRGITERRIHKNALPFHQNLIEIRHESTGIT